MCFGGDGRTGRRLCADVVAVCQFTPVFCIILTLNHADEFVSSGLLARRETDRIVHVGLLEIRKGTTSCGIM